MKPLTHLIKLLPLAVLLLVAQDVHAQAVGSVATLSGLLVAKDMNGKARVLAVNSQVRQGDTLITERNTYALMKFVDGAELTLQPESTLVLTRYTYDADKPQQDKVELNLVQGGFRSVAGLLGQRSQDATVVTTPMGTLQGSASMIVSLTPP
ncbi:hypothetical protein [Polaromonas jejuensis]|uniref:FecR protein domain-containing protein n=1 Tax=Polaromonas jejuensis TaxID=457502 RepID=A0ABW0QE88_9BURK|nr:hypothetical protein [Polaromonas jejuensis]